MFSHQSATPGGAGVASCVLDLAIVDRFEDGNVMSSLAHPLIRELETVASSEELLPGNCFWHAIRVQSKFENVASTALRSKGYEECLPLCRSKRRWSDRIKQLELPLFPGYLFCRFGVSDRLMPILTTPGVIGVVGADKTPVDAQEIGAVRAILRSGFAAQSWPILCAGSSVYIERGPLTGVEGIVSTADKVDGLVVSVSRLLRSVAVEVDREWARPSPVAWVFGPSPSPSRLP
jgi:transcription antitermination factor NusG